MQTYSAHTPIYDLDTYDTDYVLGTYEGGVTTVLLHHAVVDGIYLWFFYKRAVILVYSLWRVELREYELLIVRSSS